MRYLLFLCMAAVAATLYAQPAPPYVPPGGTVTAVTATAPLTSSGGALPNISASYNGNGSKIQLFTGAFTTNNCVKFDVNGNVVDNGAPCLTSSLPFSGLSSATNTTATMLVGTGASLSTTGSGTINANQINSGAVPTSATVVGTNGSNQVVASTTQGNGSKVQLSSGSTSTNDCVKFDANGNTVDSGASCNASPAFGTILTGTNSAATMTIGTGATMTVSGSGVNNANQVNGAIVAASATVAATNSSNQIIAATYQGNGAKVQLSTGSTTTNDVVKYDANGNTVDAGILATAVITGTPTNHGVALGSSTQALGFTSAGTSGYVLTGNGGSSDPTFQALVHSISGAFDGGGNALSSGKSIYQTIPYGCTIQAWNIVVDTGTATVDIWKVATGTAIPTISNTITASATPAISTGTAVHSTTLTGWTTSVSQNDIMAFNLKAVSSATYVGVSVQCQ
jgi:hypothetical protein